LEVGNVNHFDWLAPLYDLVIQPPDHEKLRELLRLPIDGYLLDAGGGTGRIAVQLRGQTGQIVVADDSLPMLAVALEKACCTVTGSHTEQLPFPNDTFQRVIAVDAYHHLADQAASLAEFWRVLAPGGRMVIEEPDIDNFGVKLVALAEKLTFFRSHFVRAERIAADLKSLGAQVEVHREGHNVWVVGLKG
jgi:ubiquinone/menaquinone biosynthesis C-methylase UbiE